MYGADLRRANLVHCRIGSSEIGFAAFALGARVHCRIGSSESEKAAKADVLEVHCRIGSSEKAAVKFMPLGTER